MSISLTNKEWDECLQKANYLIERGYTTGLDLIQLADTLAKSVIEKKEREILTDSRINFNDEIVSIEEVGEKDTIDITVTGDNLFLCNNILTKNSIGITHTLDLYLAIINTEDLTALGQVMLKQLKNRYGDLSYYNKFVVGLDKPKMRFYNLEDGAQQNISESGQTDVIDEEQFKASKDRKFDFNFN